VAVGYMYVLTNSAFSPDLVKVGYTCGEPQIRARDSASVTGVPQDFTIEYFALSRDVEDVEKLIHPALDEHRINDSREFFRLSVSDAIEKVKSLLREPVSSYRRPGNGILCRRCGATKDSGQAHCSTCGF
jgi:hypothetical protein